MTATFTVTTANQPGAVGIVQVAGAAREVLRVLEKLTAKPQTAWPVGRLRLSAFADIDEGLAGRLTDTAAQLMPHGGPRVMQILCDWLRDHGVAPADPADTIDTRSLYPEAKSPIEADVLHAIATAASPAAVDRLAAQPGRWRNWSASSPDAQPPTPNPQLDHLLRPPTVVVAGPPNVGKSTLLNRLLGRTASVVADLPGTTRDWVGGLVELVPPGGDATTDAVAVRWLDTPGLHASGDQVEQAAIRLARGVIAQADVLISLQRSDGQPLPESALPRRPGLDVINEFDPDAKTPCPDAITINALHGTGIDTLTAAVLNQLGLNAPEQSELWAFSPTLRRWAGGEAVDLAGYLGA